MKIMTFGRELVVLLTKPSMFGKFLVHAWSSGSALKAMTRNHVSAYFRPPMYVLKNHSKFVKII
jgi:hypothetical protein